jgi:hypothetical protein
MSVRKVPINPHQRARREGRESRADVVAYLADAMTSPDNPITSEQLNELRSVGFYFPDLSEPIAKVAAQYDDRPDLRQAILLAAAVQLLELLIDPPPAAPKPQRSRSATVAVVPS